MSQQETRPPICDYEGSTYRTDFWEGRGRNYEDRVERIALRKLLPPTGQRLLELGAGFGRLTNEYAGYEQIILLDYSTTQLKQAQEHLGREGRYLYVAADVYQMPFKSGVFDAVTMIRVLHHIANIEAALAEIRRTLTPKGSFVLEHASKLHLKSMLRYWMHQQTWNPFDLEPIEFVELNFDFHPKHVHRALKQTGFDVKRRLPVSLLRMPGLKERVPVGILAGIDALFQETGWLITPSVFTLAQARGSTPDNMPVENIFACPRCGSSLMIDDSQQLVCEHDGLRWQVRDGIYDFKAPINGD